MKFAANFAAIAFVALSLSACGGTDEKTTVIHDRPVVVQQPVYGNSVGDVEASCAHGYDNSTHRCY